MLSIKSKTRKQYFHYNNHLIHTQLLLKILDISTLQHLPLTKTIKTPTTTSTPKSILKFSPFLLACASPPDKT